MCYSAEASFIAAGTLAATSVAIGRLPKVKSAIPLAIIPVVFAGHQLIEGGIWLAQEGSGLKSIEPLLVWLYVLIAYIFWPVFIPYAAYRLEPGHHRRTVILICQVIGLVVGVSYLLGSLHNPVSLSVCSNNLSYTVSSTWNLGLGYLVAVSLPFLVSSQRGLVLFGLAILASCGLALKLESMPSFPSVWCFFAAILSAGLYAYFRSAVPEEILAHLIVNRPAG